MTVKWNGGELGGRIEQAAMRGVVSWIGMVEQRAVDLIMGPPKTGRIYIRRGIAHQASAPGEAPASDAGALVNNRTVELIPDRLAARLTFRSAHALPLEAGTRKMEPRPFARRALREREAEGQGAVAAEIRAELA